MGTDNEQSREKYLEFQLLMQQFQQLQQNQTALEKHIKDLFNLKANLETVSNLNSNSESLIPLGSGIFLKGELKDTETVVINVGVGICVEKTVEEAKETVSNQLNEVTVVLEQINEDLEETKHKLMDLQNELQSMNEISSE